MDLRGKILDDMLSAGLIRENIDFCELCTCENEQLFFSHRREHRHYGGMHPAYIILCAAPLFIGGGFY